MKKLIFSLAMMTLMAGMVGCKKDNPNNHNSATAGEGIYNPTMRIAQITEGSTTQTWEWGSSKLASIMASNGGSVLFDYTGNRISNVTSTLISNSPMQFKYDYDDGWLSKMSVISDNRNIVIANIRHNANDQISGMSATINEDYLMGLIGNMIGFGKKNSQKLTFTNQDIQISYMWEGRNVNRAIVTANLTGSITASDIVDIVGSENLGELGGLISLISGEFPLSISMKDTMDYSYDKNNNPFYMLLSEGPTATVLSENNPTTMNNHGTVRFNTTITIPFLGMEYPIDQTQPINTDESWSYEYNEKGFPTKITNSESTQIITYTE